MPRTVPCLFDCLLELSRALVAGVVGEHPLLRAVADRAHIGIAQAGDVSSDVLG